MRNVTVAATQMACGGARDENIARADALVRAAAARGAQVVLLQELFETRYFCQDECAAHFALATPLDDNPAIAHFRAVARALGVVLPISFFERAGKVFFNTCAVIDAHGSVLGRYRKTHIPDGPGYSEKYYFSPGDTGFRVWNTQAGRIGVGICWDQWFPEAARAMALMGAELLLYPTAIGSEPRDASLDSAGHWQRAMQGHAAANMVPVIASNRIGTEPGMFGTEMVFYGSSFIADHTGAKIAEAPRDAEDILVAAFDLDAIDAARTSWGLFRDRRPAQYRTLLTLDGAHHV